MSAYRKLVSSEAIALLAILCIVAIFLGAHYQRRMDTSDDQALKVAQEVYQILAKLPAPATVPATGQTSQITRTSGPAAVTLLGLNAMGLKDPAPIRVQVLDSDPRSWKVAVEHPQGLKRYIVTRQGVKEVLR
jgi:hypothetical protein